MALLMRKLSLVPPYELTKVGGLPYALPNTGWVRCRTCRSLMQFLGQIDLEETAIPDICHRKQLLLIFMCTNDPGMCDEWEPDSGGNAAILVSKTTAMSVEVPCDREDFILEETLLALEECDDSSDAYCELFNQSKGEVYGKLGGEPLWIQCDKTPRCDCGAKMTFVIQLEYSGEVEFGDAGSGYGFVCSICQDRAKFFSQSC